MKTQSTLLDQIKSVPVLGQRADTGDFEKLFPVALAWARKEITEDQIATVMKMARANIGSKLGRVLARAIRMGRLVEP